MKKKKIGDKGYYVDTVGKNTTAIKRIHSKSSGAR